jgi:hypothetical protein
MSGQKSAAYEKLTLLNDEISQGIKNLSSEPADRLDTEIEELKTNSFRDRAPEAEFALQLFRKYADVANTIKDDRTSNKNSFPQISSMLDSVPQFVYEGNREELAGRESFRKNIFWYRSVVFVMAFIVFMLFVTIREVRENQTMTPQRMMDVRSCLGTLLL